MPSRKPRPHPRLRLSAQVSLDAHRAARGVSSCLLTTVKLGPVRLLPEGPRAPKNHGTSFLGFLTPGLVELLLSDCGVNAASVSGASSWVSARLSAFPVLPRAIPVAPRGHPAGRVCSVCPAWAAHSSLVLTGHLLLTWTNGTLAQVALRCFLLLSAVLLWYPQGTGSRARWGSPNPQMPRPHGVRISPMHPRRVPGIIFSLLVIRSTA